MARTEDELRQKEEELNKLREKAVKDESARKEMEENQTQLMEEKNQLYIQLQRVSLILFVREREAAHCHERVYMTRQERMRTSLEFKQEAT